VTTFCTKVKSSDPDSVEANLSGATALEGVPMLVLGGGMSRYAARCWRRWGLGNIIFSGLRWRPGKRTGGFCGSATRWCARLARTLGGLLSRPLEYWQEIKY
jgi:hypothetical protein